MGLARARGGGALKVFFYIVPRPQVPVSMSTDPPTPVPDSPLSISRHRKYRFSTLCSTVENPSQKDQYGASSVPIYQTATFKGVDGQYDYTRSGNPTRSHLGELHTINTPTLNVHA